MADPLDQLRIDRSADHTATMDPQSFSQVAFTLTVSPRLLIGGIFRAVRTPIALGLRGL